MDAASKLQEYRLRKRRVEKVENLRTKLLNMIPFYNNDNKNENCDNVIIQPVVLPVVAKISSPTTEIESDLILFPENNAKIEELNSPTVPSNKYLRYLWYAMLFLFWATCYAIAIELKFGIVFLMFSILFGMYFNTRTGPKNADEISAYSVFNKNCQSIDGTLKAEQFEKEIRFGAAGVR